MRAHFLLDLLSYSVCKKSDVVSAPEDDYGRSCYFVGSQIFLRLQGKVYHVHKVRGRVKWQIQVSCSDSSIATHEYMVRQDLTLGTSPFSVLTGNLISL